MEQRAAGVNCYPQCSIMATPEGIACILAAVGLLLLPVRVIWAGSEEESFFTQDIRMSWKGLEKWLSG